MEDTGTGKRAREADRAREMAGLIVRLLLWALALWDRGNPRQWPQVPRAPSPGRSSQGAFPESRPSRS